MTHMLEIRNVKKNYGSTAVLRGASLAVRRGEVVSILGSSGAGKSTLMRCVNHLEAVDAGTISVDGQLVGYDRRGNHLHEVKPSTLCRQRRDIGMVFQHFNLFGHLSALDNVTLGPRKVLGRPRAEAEEEARDLLAQVGLAEHAGSYPRQLSGGQQQRVAIARAMAMRPKLMLFDEPTSALDPHLVGEVLRVIRQLADSGMTMVIVTHEVRFALDVSDRIVLMDSGTVAYDARPQEWLTSTDPLVTTFMGHFKASLTAQSGRPDTASTAATGSDDRSTTS
ncbi:amino acid ABC transporter ATP-binding protein [Streptomyces sp. NBC_00056]|uniref:amino acid ABC transporter ATP-binding protein n=1 Tax=Streptomyces sp. NBC_00056 TaxID=2975633 RepID=UPI003251E873